MPKTITPMITINREICEGFVFPEDSSHVATTNQKLARIACEIAERLEEMEELQCMSSGTLVSKLSTVRVISPKAYRIAIQLLHGNLNSLRSYAAQAAERGISRQTVFLEFKNEVDRIAHIFPELAALMRDLHQTALRHEDPVDPHDALRQTRALA